MYPKHSCHFRQTVGGCHNICIQFLILYRAVIGLRSIPSFKALLCHSALAQDIDHIKMPFGNQFVSSRFFQPKEVPVYLTGEFFAAGLALPNNVTVDDVEVPLRNLGIFLK